MNSREELQKKLEAIPGIKKVYFQPPAGFQLEFDCIVYKLEGGTSKFGDDGPYMFRRRYSVTYIHNDPDSVITDYLATSFRMCRFDRRMVVDNLTHDIYALYY